MIMISGSNPCSSCTDGTIEQKRIADGTYTDGLVFQLEQIMIEQDYSTLLSW